MTPVQIIFLATSALILISSLYLVTRRNLVHAALYLVLTLFGVAVLFVLLEASFLAVVQVLIYIGAIAILMIFAIMLTRHVAAEEVVYNRNQLVAGLIAFLVFSILVIITSLWPQFRAQAPALSGETDVIAELGQSLVNPDAYIIPFEVASVLLLAALIGAIVIAWPRKKAGGS